ncbi:nucleotidyltransferase family protein [Armatimonas sp.]|uniref:nucleotidyltransferase family protein n=1 Tax=Armatimonas sp. TaxID=1872638 RepID=UPI003752E839
MQSSKAIDVVVLASGINRVSLFEGYVPGYKALIMYHGRTSIQYVLDALQGVPAVRRICIEGPRQLLEQELAGRLSKDPLFPEKPLTIIEGGVTFLDSLIVGLEHFAASPAVLFITADLPLVTAAAIEDFLCAYAYSASDLAIAVVPRKSYTGAYTHFTKPFNRYRDISICHGNLFIASPKLLRKPALKAKINRFYAGRKNAIATTLALGWKLAFIYMFGVEIFHRLTLTQMAQVASKQLGFQITPLLIEHPGISIDVDEPDDYAFVRDRIEESWV